MTSHAGNVHSLLTEKPGVRALRVTGARRAATTGGARLHLSRRR
jgi:hypothetical protein